MLLGSVKATAGPAIIANTWHQDWLLVQHQEVCTIHSEHHSVNESLQMHFKVAVRTFDALNTSRWFPHKCSEGETVVIYALVWKSNCTRKLKEPGKMQLPSSSYNHNTLNPPNLCEWDITNALQYCSKNLSCSLIQAGDSLTDVLRERQWLMCMMKWAVASWTALCN